MALGGLTGPIRPKDLEDLPAGWLAGGAAVAGLGALAASSCCVLPLALAGLGAGGAAFSALAVLSGLRPLLLGVALLALTAGWVLFFRRRSCAPPASSTLMAVRLGGGTALAGLALLWGPYFEPILLRIVR